MGKVMIHLELGTVKFSKELNTLFYSFPNIESEIDFLEFKSYFEDFESYDSLLESVETNYEYVLDGSKHYVKIHSRFEDNPNQVYSSLFDITPYLSIEEVSNYATEKQKIDYITYKIQEDLDKQVELVLEYELEFLPQG